MQIALKVKNEKEILLLIFQKKKGFKVFSVLSVLFILLERRLVYEVGLVIKHHNLCLTLFRFSSLRGWIWKAVQV